MSSSEKIFLSLTVLGKTDTYCHKKNYTKSNSDIFVTGCIGDAGLGYELMTNDSIYNCSEKSKKRLIQKELGAAFGKELLNKVRKELKKHGGVKPPREFVLVDRAAIGLGSVFMNLKAELNWHKEFEKLISNFDVRKIKSNQSKIIKQV